MINIDLDNRTDAELRELNREIVDILNRRRTVANTQAAMSFKVGDRVKFDTKKYPYVIEGVLTKINKTTACVKPDQGLGWKVSCSLLKAVS